MSKKRYTKHIYEGGYVAKVEVELIVTCESWSPYPSLEDAGKLDDVREMLRRGDIKAALKQAQVFKLTPVTPSE